MKLIETFICMTAAKRHEKYFKMQIQNVKIRNINVYLIRLQDKFPFFHLADTNLLTFVFMLPNVLHRNDLSRFWRWINKSNAKLLKH